MNPFFCWHPLKLNSKCCSIHEWHVVLAQIMLQEFFLFLHAFIIQHNQVLWHRKYVTNNLKKKLENKRFVVLSLKYIDFIKFLVIMYSFCKKELDIPYLPWKKPNLWERYKSGKCRKLSFIKLQKVRRKISMWSTECMSTLNSSLYFNNMVVCLVHRHQQI